MVKCPLFTTSYPFIGSLDTLKQVGHLYDIQEKESLSHPMWGGPIEKHVAEPLQKNKFTQDLDKLDQGEVEVRVDCQKT